jgi:hypothetical protein
VLTFHLIIELSCGTTSHRIPAPIIPIYTYLYDITTSLLYACKLDIQIKAELQNHSETAESPAI